jgi:hypothetical protein
MNRTVLIGAVTAVLGSLAVATGSSWVWSRLKAHESRQAHSRAEEREAAANELAAARAATGKAYLAAGNWDAALEVLRQARDTENASDLQPIDSLIAQAEQGKADTLFADAQSALGRRDVTEGVRLLTTYLAHPRATRKKRADRLLAQVRRATAADQAAALLRELSAEQLNRLDAGDPPRAVLVSDALVRPIFLDTLRAHLPAERARRAELLAAQRAEAQLRARQRLERENLVRQSPPYKEMASLAIDLEKRFRAEQALLEKQKRALARLTGELNLAGEELATLRKELDEAEQKSLSFHQTFTARRGVARKAFQSLAGFTPADVAVFDQLLDRLGDGLRPGRKS